jgi:hypothetical protein
MTHTIFGMVSKLPCQNKFKKRELVARPDLGVAPVTPAMNY